MTGALGLLPGRVERLRRLVTHADVPGCACLEHGRRWRRLLDGVARQPGATAPRAPPARARAGDLPRRARHRLPGRSVRRAASWPTSAAGRLDAFGGTSVAAPTNAGLFADTNQGCFSQLGRVGPALYAASRRAAPTSPTSRGQQRLHRHQRRATSPPGAGYDLASGLGTPGRPEPGHRPAGGATGARRWRR